MKRLLHVGCGSQTKSKLKGFDSDQWEEIRFDIDPNVNPDICGSLTDMSLVESSSVSAIASHHNIEHIFAHEVLTALREFHRVLDDDGIVVLSCPDLESVCAAVAGNKIMEPLYKSELGPISPLDILYGHRESIARGDVFMAHKCGFTYQSLVSAFVEAGFESFCGGSMPYNFELWIVASKKTRSAEEIQMLASDFLP